MGGELEASRDSRHKQYPLAATRIAIATIERCILGV